MKCLCRHYIAVWERCASTAQGDPGALGFKSSEELIQFSHHRAYLTKNICLSLKDKEVTIPAADLIMACDMKPAVPYADTGKKRRQPAARILSRGEKPSGKKKRARH